MLFNLEPWDMRFADSLAESANNENIARYLRDAMPFPYTPCDAKAYIAACVQADEAQQICRAIVCNGKAVGSVGLFRQADVYRISAELGYWLAEPYWGKGVMTQAVKTLCEDAFGRWDIQRIFAEPFAHNAASRRVLEKSGFHLEGIMQQSVLKRGAVYDSCMYALLRSR